MDEARLAYRLRTAEATDDAALRRGIGATLAHPDQTSHRESYRGASSRGDILVLERYDRPSHDWQVAGFIECHMRVDDNLSIRDIGTTGEEPQTGVVRYLLDQAFNSFRPIAAQVKIRRDARNWLAIIQAIPGFAMAGEEYRRPHYWTIWEWDRQRAHEQSRPAAPARPAASARPAAPARPAPPRPAVPARPLPQRGARPPASPEARDFRGPRDRTARPASSPERGGPPRPNRQRTNPNDPRPLGQPVPQGRPKNRRPNHWRPDRQRANQSRPNGQRPNQPVPRPKPQLGRQPAQPAQRPDQAQQNLPNPPEPNADTEP